MVKALSWIIKREPEILEEHYDKFDDDDFKRFKGYLYKFRQILKGE